MKAPTHIRHHGLMIDASFRRDGSVKYYVVERAAGRFATLEIAKQIAEHRATWASLKRVIDRTVNLSQ